VYEIDHEASIMSLLGGCCAIEKMQCEVLVGLLDKLVLNK